MAEVIGPDQHTYSVLERVLAEHSLCMRGWVFPDGEAAFSDPELRLADGGRASAICLVGHGGGGFWPVFEAWQRAHPGVKEPLDSWSKAVLAPLAAQAGGEAVFPSDKPWRPFQQWAMAAEGLKASPLGLLIHPEYGLWHGYRGAILFGDMGWACATGSLTETSPHPCDACVARPCVSTCPVGAFGANGFDVGACRAHLATDAGRYGCMRSGCLARDACPVGWDYRYGAAQIRFHMAAFV